MDTRERFVRTLLGEEVDRAPFMKVFGTKNFIHSHWEAEYPGIGECIDELLGFEGENRGWERTDVNMGPSNLGEREVLEEKENYLVRRLGDGTVERIIKNGDYHHQTVEWPVKTPHDWAAYKKKYLDPDDPSRFPDDWDNRVEEYRSRDYPLQLTHKGVYGFVRKHMGDQNLAYAFYDEPGMVHDMIEHYTDMAISLWEKQTADVDFDLIECWEDMASKTGPIISPGMFKEFLAPAYRRIADFAGARGIRIILVDSDGFIEQLTGLMLDSGVNAMYPYEAGAGNDLMRVRKMYPEMGIIGGLRKEAIYEGKRAIDEEVEKARILIREKRYIPGPDHFVLKIASFENYKYFMEKLRDVVMTTTPGS